MLVSLCASTRTAAGEQVSKLRRPEAARVQRLLMADWRRPALGNARPKPAIQDVALNVSKVA